LVYFPIYPLGANFFKARPEIRLVALYSVGLDKIDLEAARASGVVVTNTPDVLTDATANLTIAHILALTRGLVQGDRMVRAGAFKDVRPSHPLGSDLEGKTLGVFGMGRVGKAVAKKAISFGLRIIYHDLNRSPDIESSLGAQHVDFEALLSDSDIVSINAPLTDKTTGIFNYKAFKKMKPSAYLINTGRGKIVVEADLVRALKEGLIRGAGLDVFEHEPEVHPGLLEEDKAVLTPHIGSGTVEVRNKMSLMVAKNVIAFLEGRDPPNRVV
jgi:glyoxylate reductase